MCNKIVSTVAMTNNVVIKLQSYTKKQNICHLSGRKESYEEDPE